VECMREPAASRRGLLPPGEKTRSRLRQVDRESI
jgi:hypothetical protein